MNAIKDIFKISLRLYAHTHTCAYIVCYAFGYVRHQMACKKIAKCNRNTSHTKKFQIKNKVIKIDTAHAVI